MSAARSRPGTVKVAQAPRAEAPPTWQSLTPAQKQALGPLTGTWSKLSEAHKRKWIALSDNFAAKPKGADGLVRLGGRAGAGSNGCRCGKGGSGDRCLHELGRTGARDANAQVVLLHFDLGEVRFVEDVGQIADERLIDAVFLVSHGSEPLVLLMS